MPERYVKQFMSTPVRTVTAATSLADAATELVERDVGALVVVDDVGHLAGIITATDVVRFVDRVTEPTDTTVGQFMRTDVVTTTPDTTVVTVAATMVDRRIHHVPVVDRDDDPVGMFSTMDVAATVADH